MDTNNVKKIGIVGAGLMGHGIALQFALKGYDVMLNDLEEEQLEQAKSSISINLNILQDLDMVVRPRLLPKICKLVRLTHMASQKLLVRSY